MTQYLGCYNFSKKESQRKWVEKSKVVNEVLKQKVEESENFVKLYSKEFKEQIDKFSKFNKISKRKARKKFFWQTIEPRKTQNDLKMKSSKVPKTQFVKNKTLFSSY